VVDGCGGVFVGTKPDGQLCGSGNQSGGLECDPNGGPKMCFWTQSPSNPSITGTCMPIPHGKQGDACVTTCYKGDDCSGDLYAWTGADTANCFETEGLYCKHEDNGVATCAPLLPHGAACSTTDYDACGSGNYCDWNDSTCKASQPSANPAKPSLASADSSAEPTTNAQTFRWPTTRCAQETQPCLRPRDRVRMSAMEQDAAMTAADRKLAGRGSGDHIDRRPRGRGLANPSGPAIG
jgi:hypothetical protein